MNRDNFSRPVLTILLGLALLLPILVTVLYLLGLVLRGMQDAGGEAVLGYLTLAAAGLWLVVLALLVVLLATLAVGMQREPPPE